MVAALGVGSSSLVAACMSRPVAEVQPHTSNLYVEPVRNEVIDKLDLLFMIDNSASMADKQVILAEAVPKLVDRLVVPRCVSEGSPPRTRASLNEACPAGFEPEFRAVNDIHVAVITSSLGAHGADSSSCKDTPPTNDRARLLPKVRAGLSDYNGSGSLAWDPGQKLVPPGEQDATRLAEQFGDMVHAAGESGCGYEGSLEAWYRFLVDPEPPLEVKREGDRSVVQGIDNDVLNQRKAFLRPDSLVAIVMLTDENDCSVRDDGYANLVADSSRSMLRSSSACATDPNSPCCVPCLVSDWPAGCPARERDAACALGATFTDEADDNQNQRCIDQKRRFGIDLLYPTSRYIDALTKPQVARRSDGVLVPNPLFDAPPGVTPRLKENVYLAGIVGVPWQDIADDASRAGAGLRYLTARELTEQKRWPVILGDPAQNVPPSDPFMHQSTAPRSGQNPITMDPIVPETSLDPRANAINGHEQIDVDRSDLQYACTFELAPDPCEEGEACDCQAEKIGNVSDLDHNRPLCQPPGGGAAQTTQYFGKAYPGLRYLEVLKGIGDSAIVASICPKVLSAGQPGYGYEPAVDALIERFRIALNGRCLPRPLAVEPEAGGALPCVVVEAREPVGACTCAEPQRKLASSAVRPLVEGQLAQRQLCGTSTTPSCSAFCLCELEQAQGETLNECLNDVAGSNTPGYCYVDPFGDPAVGSPELVKDCETNKRLLRFVGPDTPQPGALAFIACLGATLH